MIEYVPTKWREIKGEYRATISAVGVLENSYYDSSKDNSTKETLDITFQLEEPVTLDTIEYTQKFVSPLVGGKTLFQQLLDIMGELTDKEGGEFDEQSLVGLKVVATIGERKGKEDRVYPTVISVRKDEKVAKTSKKDAVKDEKAPVVDLPF